MEATAQKVIREIPARFRASLQPILSKLRVCAYARVSTVTDTNLQYCNAQMSLWERTLIDSKINGVYDIDEIDESKIATEWTLKF